MCNLYKVFIHILDTGLNIQFSYLFHIIPDIDYCIIFLVLENIDLKNISTAVKKKKNEHDIFCYFCDTLLLSHSWVHSWPGVNVKCQLIWNWKYFIIFVSIPCLPCRCLISLSFFDSLFYLFLIVCFTSMFHTLNMIFIYYVISLTSFCVRRKTILWSTNLF